MPHINIEIKARCHDTDRIKRILIGNKAEFRGLDHQIDTYFHSKDGRLKLRESDFDEENHLIFYSREEHSGPKESRIILYRTKKGPKLREILEKSNGILVVVKKEREIYFIQNVKFHIDNVETLGSFIEIEARDTEGKIGKDRLEEQCRFYIHLFDIQRESIVPESYSDMILRNQKA